MVLGGWKDMRDIFSKYVAFSDNIEFTLENIFYWHFLGDFIEIIMSKSVYWFLAKNLSSSDPTKNSINKQTRLSLCFFKYPWFGLIEVLA